MKRMLWILNPHAGRGAMSGKIIGCVTAFQQAGYDVTIYITQGAQDATRVARERAGEFDRIVCAGGDGTLNEVITGLMQAETRPVLGYVPAGTTNDFAFSLGISKVPAEAAVIAAGDTLQALDIVAASTIAILTILRRSVRLLRSPMRHRSRPRTFSGVLRISSRALRR